MDHGTAGDDGRGEVVRQLAVQFRAELRRQRPAETDVLDADEIAAAISKAFEIRATGQVGEVTAYGGWWIGYREGWPISCDRVMIRVDRDGRITADVDASIQPPHARAPEGIRVRVGYQGHAVWCGARFDVAEPHGG